MSEFIRNSNKLEDTLCSHCPLPEETHGVKYYVCEDSCCDEAFGNYIEELIDNGYINEMGAPLRCQNCEEKDFRVVNDYGGEFGIEEYSLECENCGEIVGHWAFGYWEL